jgi:hypothetical protein
MFTAMIVNGTAGADTIELNVGAGIVAANVNGSVSAQPDITVTAVTINASGGGDTIKIHSTGNNPITINCGDGDDVVQITPTSHDLLDVTDDVTINGDAGTDSATLFDESGASNGTYIFQNGSDIKWGASAATLTGAVESVSVNGNALGNFFKFLADPGFEVIADGNAGTNGIQVIGTGTGNVVYKPSGTTANAGVVDLGVHNCTFSECATVFCGQVTNVQLITPNSVDVINVVNNGATGNSVTGSSGGQGFADLLVSGITNRLTLDVGNTDVGSPTNSVTVSGTMQAIAQLDVEGGNTANAPGAVNNLVFNGGTWSLIANVFSGRTPWNVTLNSSSVVTVATDQDLRRLEINGGSTAHLSGTAGDYNQFAVASGNGTIDVASGGNLDVVNQFSIAAGSTLTKTGTGQVSTGAATVNVHGAGSTLQNNAGQFNLNSDAGSAASRNLSLFAHGGLIGLASTQHVAGVFADTGTIKLFASGNRVLVTTNVGEGSEGGQIDLTNNDMIVDYTGTSQLDSVRQLIKQGYGGGTWNGIGIASSTAAAAPHNTGLGYAEATEQFGGFPATFSGQQVDNTAVLVKYTWYGDANLDGQVDVTDLGRLATNWQLSSRRWTQGDFNYDLTVNVTDLGQLATNWQLGVGNPLGRTVTGSGVTNRQTARVTDDVLGVE